MMECWSNGFSEMRSITSGSYPSAITSFTACSTTYLSGGVAREVEVSEERTKEPVCMLLPKARGRTLEAKSPQDAYRMREYVKMLTCIPDLTSSAFSSG